MKASGRRSSPWRFSLNGLNLTFLGLCVSLAVLSGGGDPAFAGTIKGRVNTSAESLPKAPPRYYLGPYRSARAPSALTEGDPTDIVVYLQNAPDSGPVASDDATMEQKEETFFPHVLPIVAGTTVTFPNKDNFYHNVFSVVAGKRFDLGRYPQGQTSSPTFTKPTVSIVRCEIHSGMKAYIVVLKNSYFAVPNQDGQFELPAVPPGTYTVVAWHPNKKEQVKTVTVPESGAVSIDFSF